MAVTSGAAMIAAAAVAAGLIVSGSAAGAPVLTVSGHGQAKKSMAH